MNRVIARYRDGKMVKGSILNFEPSGDHLHVARPEDPYGEGIRIQLDDLKAIFFVTSFEGDPTYKPRDEFTQTLGYGHRVRVRFKDGEEMLGYAHHITPGHTGLWLFPGDPKSNNQRVFIPLTAADSVRDLDLDADFLAAEHRKPTHRP